MEQLMEGLHLKTKRSHMGDMRSLSGRRMWESVGFLRQFKKKDSNCPYYTMYWHRIHSCTQGAFMI